MKQSFESLSFIYIQNPGLQKVSLTLEGPPISQAWLEIW